MAKLCFKYGVMGCGKSEDLQRVYGNYTRRKTKNNVIVLKSDKDTRDIGVIRSRKDKDYVIHCKMVDDNIDLFKYTSILHNKEEINCVLVDEVQFMTVEQIHQLWDIAKILNIPVIAYGVKINYKGWGFPASNELLAIAHNIEEIKTTCSCDRKATHHLLYVDGTPRFDGDGVFVGDTDYVSVCSSCWYKVKSGGEL